MLISLRDGEYRNVCNENKENGKTGTVNVFVKRDNDGGYRKAEPHLLPLLTEGVRTGTRTHIAQGVRV